MSSKQSELFDSETEAARSLLDHLLAESKLYKTSKGYWDLLQFTSKLRNFAPFNAMLLHIQKLGLTYAASSSDWLQVFGSTPKIDARPLLILWPFGPVALVYDVQAIPYRSVLSWALRQIPTHEERFQMIEEYFQNYLEESRK